MARNLHLYFVCGKRRARCILYRLRANPALGCPCSGWGKRTRITWELKGVADRRVLGFDTGTVLSSPLHDRSELPARESSAPFANPNLSVQRSPGTVEHDRDRNRHRYWEQCDQKHRLPQDIDHAFPERNRIQLF